MSDEVAPSRDRLREWLLEWLGSQRKILRVHIRVRFRDAFDRNPTNDEYHTIKELIHDLLLTGILMLGAAGEGGDWELTSLGEIYLKEGSGSPYDPDGYIKRLKQKVPELDDIASTYLFEAVSANTRFCFLSAAVCLGAASEQVVLSLIGAFAKLLSQGEKLRFEKRCKGRTLQGKYKEFKKRFTKPKDYLPDDLADEVEAYIDPLFQAIRFQRNEAGHPTGNQPERDLLNANIRAFPIYAKRVYAVISEWESRAGP